MANRAASAQAFHGDGRMAELAGGAVGPWKMRPSDTIDPPTPVETVR